MGQKYLLPCACGQKQIVDRTDAGRTLQCGCGKPLEVPTLLRIGSLEPAAAPPTDDARRRPTAELRWGMRQQMLALGAIVMVVAALVALVITAYFRLFAPHPIPVENAGPQDALAMWDSLRAGIAGDPEDRSAELLRAVDRDYKRRMFFAAAIGGVGLLLFLIGLAVPRARAFEPTSPEDAGA